MVMYNYFLICNWVCVDKGCIGLIIGECYIVFVFFDFEKFYYCYFGDVGVWFCLWFGGVDCLVDDVDYYVGLYC